jgi:hypothetical protein
VGGGTVVATLPSGATVRVELGAGTTCLDVTLTASDAGALCALAAALLQRVAAAAPRPAASRPVPAVTMPASADDVTGGLELSGVPETVASLLRRLRAAREALHAVAAAPDDGARGQDSRVLSCRMLLSTWQGMWLRVGNGHWWRRLRWIC